MTEKLFDLEASLKRFGGDRELFGEMVQFFREDAPPLLAQIERALERGDAREAERGTHSLKGLAANFGAEPAVNAARAMEEQAKAGQLDAVRDGLPGLCQQVDRLLAALEPLAKV